MFTAVRNPVSHKRERDIILLSWLH